MPGHSSPVGERSARLLRRTVQAAPASVPTVALGRGLYVQQVHSVGDVVRREQRLCADGAFRIRLEGRLCPAVRTGLPQSEFSCVHEGVVSQ